MEEDPVLGNVVEIEHDKGVVTQYQSVKDIKIKVGDEVKQGQVLAKAGQSLFNEKAGTHVHFEIRKDGVAVNPESYFNKPVSALADAEKTQSTMPDAKKDGQKMDDSKGSTDSTNGDSSKGSTDSSNGDSSKDSTDGTGSNPDGSAPTDPSTDSTTNSNS